MLLAISEASALGTMFARKVLNPLGRIGDAAIESLDARDFEERLETQRRSAQSASAATSPVQNQTRTPSRSSATSRRAEQQRCCPNSIHSRNSAPSSTTPATPTRSPTTAQPRPSSASHPRRRPSPPAK
uniref:Uncharacterized protein n=1 Tax=Mycena chlorophos TaxID=658473 RepID=A0ABQ0L941_MYCCL|nr:predicted protein [Mycena chlorophos]